MIRKIRSPRPHHIRVVFELPACLWADRVYVVGEFNNWDQSGTRLQQDRDGVWRTSLDLPAGERYRFHYLIDGCWHTDDHADGFADDLGGLGYSVIHADMADLVPALAFAR